MKKKFSKELAGFFGFLILIIPVVLITNQVSIFIKENLSHNKFVASLLIFSIIIFFTTFCYVVDNFRRKKMIDEPIEKILNATNKITKGDFSVKLEPIHKPIKYDELDYIMIHLNILTEELSKNEIINNNFIANISHEIKTPLSIIQNYCSALLSPSLTEKEKKEYCKVLIDTTKKLTNLVTNILKLNKLENQVIKPNIQKINITETIRECTLNYIDKIEEKNINLNLNLEEIFGYTDKGMLEIVVNNLISNAVKFTKNDISISLTETKNYAVLKVSDNGIGMSKNIGEHIFDKFYQGETSHSDEGNGLGLALVKKVIDILGGEISVNSEVEIGSNFIVKIGVKNNE